MTGACVVYAVCSRCGIATRLTPSLALLLASKPGPPLSLCCGEDMRLESRPA